MSTGALRVLIVPEQLRRQAPGGIGTYTENLLRELTHRQERGELGDVEIELYASAPRSRPDRLEVFRFPLRSSHLPGRALVPLWDAGLVRAPRGADIVHHVSLSGPASDATIVTTVYDLAWRHVPEAFPPRGRRWHEAALERALRRRAHLVVPSVETRDDLYEAGASSELVTVIPGGADHLNAPKEQATEQLLARAGVHGGFFLAVGTREPRKNLERLVAAYRLARPELDVPMPLVLVGPKGWGSDDTADGSGVVALGQVTPSVLASLYARAHLVGFVPLFEGFGLPVLEAMVAGAPVVASAVPTAGDAVELVEPTSIESIAAGIVAVANDESRRADLIRRGREHAARFTWSATATAHLALWQEIGAR